MSIHSDTTYEGDDDDDDDDDDDGHDGQNGDGGSDLDLGGEFQIQFFSFIISSISPFLPSHTHLSSYLPLFIFN